MADEQGEKTEQPTGKRLGDARERGQVPRSPEAGAAVTILAAAGMLSWSGAAPLGALADLLATTTAALRPQPWDLAYVERFGRQVLGSYMALAAPVMVAAAVAAIGANLLQAGFVLSGHPLRPNWGRLSPLAGLRKLFGRAALVELAKAPLKLVLVGVITYVTVRPALPALFLDASESAPATMATVVELVTRLLWRLGLAHAALAALDYGYQRWSYRRGLRMTREEIRDETRQAEGDPIIRARFRSLHRQYALRRMMQDVAGADVVVTNPTHLAIALRYDAASMRAPRVVAKGARLVAERIRERARAAGVPIVEHKPLAQALFKAVPIGGEIPGALYRAVAEILAYVWALGHRRGAYV